jgi:hypothetical protein
VNGIQHWCKLGKKHVIEDAMFDLQDTKKSIGVLD